MHWQRPRGIDSLPSKTFVILLLLLFVSNKILIKQKISFIYLLDLFIIVGTLALFIQKPTFLIRITRALWPFLAIFLLSFFWLLSDFYTTREPGGDSIVLTLRRWAMAYYMLLPVIITAYLWYIYTLARRTIWLLVISILGIGFYSRVFAVDFSASLAALVMATFLLGLLFGEFEGQSILKKVALLAVVIIGFAYLVKDPSGGFLRSPVLSLLVGFLVSIYYTTRNLLGHTQIYVPLQKALLVAFAAGSVAFLGVVGVNTHVGKSLVSEAMCSFQRTTSLFFQYSSAACSFDRKRGDPAGTVKTRVAFWKAILIYSYNNPMRFLVGNGHTKGFLEVVPKEDPALRIMAFRDDAPLIEPHNSYIGIFFRYGIAGLFLLFAGLYNFTKTLRRQAIAHRITIRPVVGIKAALLTYLFTEVVLEVPYGALAFWMLWTFSEILFSESRA